MNCPRLVNRGLWMDYVHSPRKSTHAIGSTRTSSLIPPSPSPPCPLSPPTLEATHPSLDRRNSSLAIPPHPPAHLAPPSQPTNPHPVLHGQTSLPSWGRMVSSLLMSENGTLTTTSAWSAEEPDTSPTSITKRRSRPKLTLWPLPHLENQTPPQVLLPRQKKSKQPPGLCTTGELH